jgi:hypothetical protein
VTVGEPVVERNEKEELAKEKGKREEEKRRRKEKKKREEEKRRRKEKKKRKESVAEGFRRLVPNRCTRVQIPSDARRDG